MTYNTIGVYDPVSRRTISFDRWNDPVRKLSIYANALLAYDPASNTVTALKKNNWTVTEVGTGYATVPLPENTTDPTPVDRHSLGGLALDPIANTVYLVNGANQSAPTGPPNDTWRFSLTTRAWTKVADAASALHPPSDVGSWSGMVYDPPTRKLAYLVTQYPTGTHTWLFDPATARWSAPVDDPSAADVYTASAGIAYDTRRNLIVAFGGGFNIVSPASAKLRAYSVSQNKWTKLADAPLAVNNAEFAYDSLHDVFLALAGSTTLIYNPQTNLWTHLAAKLDRSTNLLRQNVTYNPAYDMFVFQGGTWDKPIWSLFRYDPASAVVAPLDPPTPAPTVPFDPASGVRLGRGCTTAWFIDEDCDGYGVGVRSSGSYGDIGLGDKPDATDLDASLNTPASVLAAYDANHNGALETSELKSFLSAKKGITAGNIYYISTTGNNATGEPNNPNKPYATYHVPPAGTSTYGVWQYLKPGDVVIYRGGTYKDPTIGGGAPTMKGGAAGSPIAVMSMPGEQVNFQILYTPLESSGASYLIVDGFTFDTPENPLRGYGISMSNTSHSIFRNIEAQRFAYTSHIDNMHDLVVEKWVVHHNLEHGIYMGARNSPSSDITLRKSILYKNGKDAGYGNFQYNGRVTNLVLEDNILHSSGQWGISFKQGVSNSIVRNNLIFNNEGHGIIFDLYDGDCVAASYTEICPYSQTNNLVTNNTFWIGKYDQDGAVPSIPQFASGILVAHNTVAIKCPNTVTPCDQGHNTFQNNIFNVYDGYAFRYVSNNPALDAPTVAGWLATSTIQNNVINRVGGSGSVASSDASVYSFASFESTFAGVLNNVFGDPLFTRATIDDWGAPQLFDLRLRSGSPAIGRGTATGAPPSDIRGVTRTMPPDAGAYAYSGGLSPPTNLRIVR
jgi:parallel beta-helix repeat protein